MISYAGVEVVAPSPRDVGWVRSHTDPSWAPPWDHPGGWPGPDLGRFGFGLGMPAGPVEVGRLVWPRGAGRWGYMHLVIDGAALDAVRRVVYQGGTLTQQLLVVADGLVSLTTPMWMLPARPLRQAGGDGSLWLLTLVDVRYFWWTASAVIAVTPAVTTWGALFADLADALDVTAMAVDPVPAAYPSPPADLGANYRALPPLLDAAAASVGMRVVRDFAGNVRVTSASSSRATLAANLALPGLTGRAGGLYLAAGVGAGAADIPAALPASVTVVFPWAPALGPDTPYYPVTVPLSSLSLPGVPPGAAGFTGTQLLRSSALAGNDGTATPPNLDTLTALATQAALDWCLWQLAPHDVAFDGIAPWTPEGLSDLVEVRHDAGGVSTRARRGPWLGRHAEELWHQGTRGSRSDAPPSFLRVTSLTQAEGYYPAALAAWDPGPLAWVDVHGADPVWLNLDPPGAAAPGVGDVYPALPMGQRPADGRALYGQRDAGTGGGGAAAFSGAYVESTGQTITNSTLTTLTWATVGYDTGSYFSSGLPTRLTVPAAGYYRITARVNWNIGPAVAALILSLSFNGTSTYEADYAHAEATTITESNSLTTVAHLAAGDYVEAQVKQTSGGSMSFLTGSGNSPTFQIEKVG